MLLPRPYLKILRGAVDYWNSLYSPGNHTILHRSRQSSYHQLFSQAALWWSGNNWHFTGDYNNLVCICCNSGGSFLHRFIDYVSNVRQSLLSYCSVWFLPLPLVWLLRIRHSTIIGSTNLPRQYIIIAERKLTLRAKDRTAEEELKEFQTEGPTYNFWKSLHAESIDITLSLLK